MAALRSRRGHYIFVLFIPSPNLTGRRVDVYHTSTHGAALVRIECRSEMYRTRLAGNTGRKNDATNCHLGTIVNFIGLNLRN